ncbi:MAG TPA: alpha/beta fold hydrolase [Gammaproteobacteria bacterium]|nr:alpha/beta fold hydrolase [Gammaproteobacteria bacterium]
MQDFDQESQLSHREQKLIGTPSSSIQYLVKPSGEYSVGYQKSKELNATVYYPSLEKIDSGSPSKLAEKVKLDIKGCQPQGGQVDVSEEDLESLDSVRTYSKEGLVVVPNQMFPVIIFSPGTGGIAGHYENTISDLASRGYIVIARDNIHNPDLHASPEASEKEPKEVLSEIISIRQSLSQLSKENPIYASMQIDQVGLLGHSMGGSVSILAAQQHPNLFQGVAALDARVDVGVDSWDIRREVKIPSLQMHATTWKLNYSGQAPDTPFYFNQNTTHILLGTDESDKYYSCHNNFKDNSTLQTHLAAQAFEQFLIGMQKQDPGIFGNLDIRTPIQTGTINGVEASKTVAECVGQFFDTSLKKKVTPIFSKDQPLKNTMVTRGDYVELPEIKPLQASSHFGSAMFTPEKKKSSEETSGKTFQEPPCPEIPNF